MSIVDRQFPSASPPSGVQSVSGVRSQAAFVRTLLDELERVAPAGSAEGPVSRQLIEELARLGCRCIEAASGLSVAFDARDAA